MSLTKKSTVILNCALCLILLMTCHAVRAQQASNISSTWLNSTTLRISWTAGSGTGETTIVVSSGDVSAPPDNPLTFTANANFGSAPETSAGSGDKIVYSGGATTVDVTNINRTYVGGEFVYNIKAFSIFKVGSSYHHNTSDGTANPRNTLGLSPEPQFQPGSPAVTGYTNNSVSFSWTSGSGTGRIAVVYTAPISGAPSDGVDYGANSQYGGAAISGVGYVVSTGNTNSVTVSGLSGGTGYYLQLFEYYDVVGLQRNYTTYPVVGTSQLTLPDAPVIAAGTSTGQNSFTANWAASTGTSGYFLDVSTDSNFGSFTSGYNNKSVGNVTSASVTGLNTATTYYYRVRANNAAGTSSNSSNASILTVTATPVAGAATSVTQTSFTANWSAVSGVTGYFLDVSTDNFSTFVTGYNNKSVGNVATISVTGLSSGVTHQYRIRSTNATGTSTSSNSISALTISPNPAATAASAVTQTSFVANWNNTTGATSYFLDVSADDFATFVTGYNNKSVGNVTSQSVTSLTLGTSYKFRVRSSNASGTSGNSNAVAVLTAPATPTAIAATLTSSSGFTANWNIVAGASSYYVDVASDAGFGLMISGYSNVSVATNKLVVTGLNAGTVYYYRVRAGNTSGISPSSSTMSVLTAPGTPTNLSVSGVTSSIFVASWNTVTGAESYEIEVSKDNFATFAANFGPASTTETTLAITGLSANTVYKFRVRAVNTGGKSGNSSSFIVPTLDSSGKSNVLAFGATQFPTTISSSGGTGKVSIQSTGGFGTVTVKFKSRKITETNFTETPVTTTGNAYEASLTSSMLDELGTEYFFTGTDDIGTTESTHSFTYTSIDATNARAIPFTGAFDGTTNTYQMFSVPYTLTDKNVSSAFVAMGAPDKKKWRLFRYQSGKYIEYPDNITTIDPGKGYWFNTKEKTDIKPGLGSATEANQTKPFSLALEKGWNQIGNPFPFAISWASVKAANPSAGINTLWSFSNSAYVKTENFNSWGGGFVFSDNGGTITIPVSARCAGCRFAESEFSSDPDNNTWQLPLRLSLNDFEQVSAIGMHPEASNSKDRFDEITVPRFINYLEMCTHHNEFFAPEFSTDILPSADNASWLFSMSSSQPEGKATLTWDKAALSASTSKLVLLDIQNQVVVDMKASDEYSFNWKEGQQFKILYSRDGEISFGVTMMGNGYPNPFKEGISIPVLLESDQQSIQINIYDLMGRKVKVIHKNDVAAGLHNLVWDGQTDSGQSGESGLYLYQLWGDKGMLSPAKRMIKQ